MSYFVASPDVSEQTQVDFTDTKAIIDYNNGQMHIELELTSDIVPAESTVTKTSRKIELKLKKKLEN